MALSSFLFGSPQRFETRPTFRQPQEAALQTLLQQGLQNLQQPGRGFEPIAQQAREGFQRQTLPGILERFSGMGDMSVTSPSLQQQTLGAGTDLESKLAALQSQYNLQQQGMGLNQLRLGLTPMDETLMFSGTQGLLGNMAPGIGQGIGKVGLPALLAYLTGGSSGLLSMLTGSLGNNLVGGQ